MAQTILASTGLDYAELIATIATDLAVDRLVAGQFDDSLAHARKAVVISRTMDKGALFADSLGCLGFSASYARDNEILHRALTQALEINKATSNSWGQAY